MEKSNIFLDRRTSLSNFGHLQWFLFETNEMSRSFERQPNFYTTYP